LFGLHPSRLPLLLLGAADAAESSGTGLRSYRTCRTCRLRMAGRPARAPRGAV